MALRRPLKLKPQNPNDEQRRERVMGNLEEAIFARLASLNPSRPISPDLRSLVKQRLQEFFPSLHTPTHPPYAWMIRGAIKGLNEKKGSSEEAISCFIRKEFEDLPWAHDIMLSHHLRKLCSSGEIVRTYNGCYRLPRDDDFEEEDENGKMSLGGKRKRGTSGSCSGESKYLSPKKINKDIVEGIQVLALTEVHRFSMLDGWSEAKPGEVEASKEENEVGRQYIEVSGKNKALGKRIEAFEEEREDSEKQSKKIGEHVQTGDQEQQVKVRRLGTKVSGFSSVGEYVQSLEVLHGKSESFLSSKEDIKKKHLKKKGGKGRKKSHGERELIVVCALLAPQSYAESMQATLKPSRDLVQLNESEIMPSSPEKPLEHGVAMAGELIKIQEKPLKVYSRRGVSQPLLEIETSLDGPTKLEDPEKKQQCELQKPEKLLDFELKTMEADSTNRQEAATAKASGGTSLDLQRFRVEELRRKPMSASVGVSSEPLQHIKDQVKLST